MSDANLPQTSSDTSNPTPTAAASRRVAHVFSPETPARLMSSMQTMRSLFVNLLMILGVLLALPVSYKVIARNALTINEFAVPAAIEERGISGKVLAQRLHDEIIAASRFTSRQIETQGSTPVALEEKLPQIDLPIQGVNLQLLVPQLRALFGFRDASISGEVVVEQPASGDTPALFSLRLRAPGEGAIFRSDAPSADVDQLLRDAAIVVLQREDPITAAYYYMFRRDYRAARRMADVAALSDNPKTRLLAVHVKGLVARGLNDWNEAATHFRTVVENNPDFRAGYSNLASALRRVDLDESERVAAAMIERFPDHWPGYNNLALARLVQRRGPEAVALMAKAEALAPRDPELHYQKHFILRAVGQHENAIAALQLAQDLNRTAIHYLEEIVRLQRDLGKLPEAAAAAGRVTVLEPANPLGYALVARVAIDTGDQERAELAIRRALTLDEDFAPALAERGRLLLVRDDLRAAEAALDRAERADARLSETWEYRGDLRARQWRYAEAIEAYRKGAEFGTFPAWRAAEPHAKLGKLLEAAGDRAGAVQSYERALRLDGRKFVHLAAAIERLKTAAPTTESEAAR